MNTTAITVIAVIVVALIAWLIWEIVTAPIMPDDYDDRMKK